MNVELRNVKIHKEMSEETQCFSATMYVDGKKAATVRNSGQGAPNMYYFVNPDIQLKVNQWALAQPMEFDFEKLDQICDKLLADTQERKALLRLAKTGIPFRLKTDREYEWRVLKGPVTAAAYDFITQKYGDNIDRIFTKE